MGSLYKFSKVFIIMFFILFLASCNMNNNKNSYISIDEVKNQIVKADKENSENISYFNTYENDKIVLLVYISNLNKNEVLIYLVEKENGNYIYNSGFYSFKALNDFEGMDFPDYNYGIKCKYINKMECKGVDVNESN